MNGSEFETPDARSESELKGGVVAPLDSIDNANLVAFSASPFTESVRKLMKRIVIGARDDMMATHPTHRDEVLAMQAIAHASAKFYEKFWNDVEAAVRDHVGEVKSKIAKAVAEERDVIEQIVLDQAR